MEEGNTGGSLSKSAKAAMADPLPSPQLTRCVLPPLPHTKLGRKQPNPKYGLYDSSHGDVILFSLHICHL